MYVIFDGMQLLIKFIIIAKLGSHNNLKAPIKYLIIKLKGYDPCYLLTCYLNPIFVERGYILDSESREKMY